jgi:hypothetical protein
MLRLRITSILIQLPTTLLWSHLSYTALEAGKTACKFLHRFSQRRLALDNKTLIPWLRLKRNLDIISGVPADGKIEIAD